MMSLRQQQDWQVGDVYKDLDLLEQSIRLLNAEQDLQHKERLETLDHFARQRRLIRPDIRNHLMAPLSYSFLIFFIVSRKPFLSQLLARISLAHVYSVTLLPPILFLVIKRAKMSPPEPPPPELSNIDPQYYRFLTSSPWEDPTTSTRDFLLCLSEQWTSAVAVFLLWGAFLPLPCRLLVRLAAWASLHQYPKLYFELYRQPRPLSGQVWTFQKLVSAMESTTPWLVATDLALWLASSPRTSLGVYGAAACLLTLWERRPSSINFMRKHGKACRNGVIFPLLIWLTFSSYGDGVRSTIMGLQTLQLRLPSLLPLARPVLSTLAVVLALLVPMCHLRAFSRLVQVVYTHNASLADPETFLQQQQDSVQWRHKLQWREPQRVRVTWDQWRRKFWYWLFFAGSVQDKLRRLRTSGSTEAQRQGLDLWQKVKDENRPFVDRSQWKQDAMDRLADKHKRDYETNTFEVRDAVPLFCLSAVCVLNDCSSLSLTLVKFLRTGSFGRGGLQVAWHWTWL
jgi:hypothetical protein